MFPSVDGEVVILVTSTSVDDEDALFDIDGVFFCSFSLDNFAAVGATCFFS